MPVRHWPAVLLALAVLCGLAGCSGNYKFNDGDYRPLQVDGPAADHAIASLAEYRARRAS